MNIISRTQCRSLAKTIVSIEQEIGTTLNTSETTTLLCDEYELLKPNDTESLSKIIKQVELEVPAERCAVDNPLPANAISKMGLAKIVVQREMGTLAKVVEGNPATPQSS